MAEIKGIDVSKYQSSIDWQKVKSDGIKFAMLRCGTGYRHTGSTDTKFEQNYKNAKAAGIAVGAYFYSYAVNVEQAKKEAEYCLSIISGKSFEYPVVFDIEDKTQSNLGKSLISDICRAFCEKIKSAGFIPCIYANKDWLENRIDDDCKSKYDVWLAQWSSKPTYTGNFTMWQYSSKGTVKGISGNVDMNISYKDYASISNKAQPKKTIDEIVKEVLDGKWGNGQDRINRLTAAGYNYTEVQAAVNKKIYGENPVKVYKVGDKINLKNKPIYVSASAKFSTRNVTGEYFIYDGINVNGRYRITNAKENCNKQPTGLYVTGWVSL